MMKNYYLDNDKTKTIFKKLKTLPTNELYNKLSITKIHVNKKIL